MDKEKVEKYIIKILENNGWYEGRKFDSSFWIKQLSDEGYICFDYAKEILEEFGGIEINVSNSNGYMGAQFDFNPFNVASGEFDRIDGFENLAKEKLFPIGSMVQSIACVGQSKNIYFGDWRNFFWNGKDIEDYLALIANLLRLIKVK